MLPVQEDDGVLPCAEEVLGGCGSAGAGREVVEKANAAGRKVFDQSAVQQIDRANQATYTLCSRGTVVPPLCWRDNRDA